MFVLIDDSLVNSDAVAMAVPRHDKQVGATLYFKGLNTALTVDEPFHLVRGKLERADAR